MVDGEEDLLGRLHKGVCWGHLMWYLRLEVGVFMCAEDISLLFMCAEGISLHHYHLCVSSDMPSASQTNNRGNGSLGTRKPGATGSAPASCTKSHKSSASSASVRLPPLREKREEYRECPDCGVAIGKTHSSDNSFSKHRQTCKKKV